MDCSLPVDLSVALTFTMALGNAPPELHIWKHVTFLSRDVRPKSSPCPATESLEYPSRPETVHPVGERSHQAAAVHLLWLLEDCRRASKT